ncbi:MULTISPECIES: hypothetical protein [Cupriavidus]|nr:MULTISPECIES: hypothetical protein [Cupriavidus]QYY32698.1 hypothetical protein K2O51_18180 [Cupriavidus pinatubonensis]
MNIGFIGAGTVTKVFGRHLVQKVINSVGVVAIDLGSIAERSAMHEAGAPLSGLDLHFVKRLR